MQAIYTKYLGPTNARGSRIKATIASGESVTIGYPHDKHEGAEAHAQAALALCQRLTWSGELIAGALHDGYVFVFAGGDRFASPVTEEQQRDALMRRLDAVQ